MKITFDIHGDMYINHKKYEEPRDFWEPFFFTMGTIVLLIIASLIVKQGKPYELQQDVQQVTSIEVVSTTENISYSAKQVEELQTDIGKKINTRNLVPQFQWEQFYERFFALSRSFDAGDEIELEGYMIRITYADGACEIIDEDSAVYLLPNGSLRCFHYAIEREEFNALAQTYSVSIKK